MATVVNFIDTTLQSATTRTVNLPTAQIILTPSAPTFHVDSGGTVTPSSITFSWTLIDLAGTVSTSCTGGTLSGATGNSVNVAAASVTGSSVTVTASITVNGTTYSAPCTISKVTDGVSGTIASYVTVDGQQVFSRATAAAAFAPLSITLTATPYGGTATYQWQYWTGSAWANVASSGTSATYAVASGDFTDQRLYRVQATIGGTVYTDQFTMVQVTGGTNGINAITGFLTNESVTLAADSGGTVASFAPAAGTFDLYDGITDKTGTGAVTYSVASQLGCTVAIASTGAYSVSAMTADTASATLQAVYGGVTIQKVLSLAKSKAGAGGAGSVGPRGAGHFYATGTTWSDTVADATCPGGKVVSDVVTISNGTTYSLEKKWDGSTWSPTGVSIDGNLLVTASVKAAAIDTKGVIVRDNAGNPIVGIGVPLAAGYEAPGTKNGDIIIGGRNLYPDSGFERGTHPCTSRNAVNNLFINSNGDGTLSPFAGSKALFFDTTGGDCYVLLGGGTAPVVAGQSYVISFYYKTASSGSITGSSSYLHRSDGAYDVISLPVLNTGGSSSPFVRVAQLWTCPSGVTSIELRAGIVCTGYSWMWVDGIKVEDGNKVTSWTPSPEDAAADTAAAQSSADAANAALTDKLSKSAASILAAPITISTGGAIQVGTAAWTGSAPTGTGIILSPKGIALVNSGVPKITMDTTTGDATFGGTLTAANMVSTSHIVNDSITTTDIFASGLPAPGYPGVSFVVSRTSKVLIIAKFNADGSNFWVSDSIGTSLGNANGNSGEYAIIPLTLTAGTYYAGTNFGGASYAYILKVML